jgi:hypothetical protein
MFCPTAKGGCFSRQGWTVSIALKRLKKSAPATSLAVHGIGAGSYCKLAKEKAAASSGFPFLH